jgi:hypothetical protein
MAGYAPVENFMDPPYPSVVLGLLDAYIRSSPDLEELFVLWDLPGRDSDKRLAAQHMRCLAAIVFCAHSNEQLCLRIQGRILRGYTKSLQGQLSSGNAALIHGTLGLLLSLCRISAQSCRDIYQKILSISISSLSMLAQKGKEVGFICSEGVKINTDARFFIALIMLCCLNAADSSLLIELMSEKSILRALISTIHTNDAFSVKVLLDSLNAVLPGQYLSKLFDRKFQQRILSLYESTNSDIQLTAHKFCTDICSKISYSSFSSGRYVFSNFVLLLRPWDDIRHKEVRILYFKSFIINIF